MSRSDSSVKRSKIPAVLIVLLVFVLVFVLIFTFGSRIFSYVKNYNEAVDPSSTEKIEFVVEKGSTTSVIAQNLEDAGLIDSAAIFRYKTKLNTMDGTYQAGTFTFSKSMTMEEIMKSLQNAPKKETARFTIPEGYKLTQIAEKLEKEGIIESADDFYEALDKSYDYWFLDGKGSGYSDGAGILNAHQNRLEGFLFPDTYEVYKDITPAQIVDKMLARFDEVFDSDMLRAMNDLGIDINDTVTIASLIERETRTDFERPLVSSVIYNRLDIDMKLQFCSTVLYSLGVQKDRLLYEDLEIDSPYNTYKYEGLPAGPIACPGRASLEAALNPDETDYLYFVLKADGSGQHNFSSNYGDFTSNKDDYLKTFN